jgi:prepilin-type N-terminal cleavage/methylation domain-containing protein
MTRPDNADVGKAKDRRATRRAFRSDSDKGFMLLEVLVALAIALIALAVLYQATIEGLLETRQAERTNEAVARARSRMAALCYGTRLISGEHTGDDGGGYSWHTRINRTATEPVPPAIGGPSGPTARAELFAVRVTLSWPGIIAAHEVSLETRCLTTGPADQP